MLPATHKKLREAKFFLACLEQQERVPVWKANAEHAEFYFNAFVSAGRSVTWTLQNEEKAKYEAWWPGWLAGRPAAEQLTMKRFNDERTEIVHRTGAEVSSRNALTPHDEVFPPTGNESVAYIMSRIGNLGSDAKVGTLQLMCRFRYDGTEAPVVDAAREYFVVLERLVADIVRKLQGAV